jgi:uncharacterized membrane protein
MSDTEAPLAQGATRWFGKRLEALDARHRRVLESAYGRQPLARDLNADFTQQLTFGERLADRVAIFGGSWIFIICFGLFLVTWAGLNLALGRGAFDPYPFIFLNLMLSMLAAIQAPIIMMSQNRQAAKDRLDAAHDYEVNLKAEIGIMALHDKLDQLRTQDVEALIVKQQEQIDLLRRLLESRPG